MKTLFTLPIRLGFALLLLSGLAFIPKDDDPLVKIVNSLHRWTDSIPQEKVYLHMDKPYYAVGDTIWFKGYVTIGSRHTLSAWSGALYVDLMNEKDSVLRTLKLPLASGMAHGDFVLGDEYRQGNYRLRAYTQWMRNAGTAYFYDHTFTVGDLANGGILSSADYQYKDVNGKPVLTATLTYTNDDGKPLTGKSIHYQIMIDKKVAWSSSGTTDQKGNIVFKIANENHANLSGAYVTTTLDGADKHTITRDFPIKAALSQSDVQFFPESGSLVNGLTSRVAFKAVGVDGLGVDIKGKVSDNGGKEVAAFNTLHAGMGSFYLRPVAGKTYTANITFADGTTKAVALPKAADDGYVISLFQRNKDSVQVRINASPKMLHTTINFIVHSGGEVVFTSPLSIDRPVTTLWVDKSTFPTGIAQFTLFTENGEPLNERIAFIRSNDLLHLSLKTAKSIYASKQQVQVDLEARDSKGKPTTGNFSVSVINETKVPFNDNNAGTILSNLLLTSDLKGYIEKPNYYFNNPEAGVAAALDNLMLTQGYRRFSWKELNTTIHTKPAFAAEDLGTAITGRVTTLEGDKPLAGATVNMLSIKAGAAKATTTDANGKFKFDGIYLMDSVKFALQASKGKSKDVKIMVDTLPKITLNKNPNLGDLLTNPAVALKAYLDNGKKEDDINEKLGKLDQVHRLREVRIRAQKKVIPTFAAQGQFKIPEGHADQTFKMVDAEHCATLGICLQGNLAGISFTPYDFWEDSIHYFYINYPHSRGQPINLLFVNGNKTFKRSEIGDIFDNNRILPDDIVKIEVVRTNLALMSMLGGPSLLIYTNTGMIRRYYTPNIINITPKGYNKVREFCLPKYEANSDALKKPDLRTTIYWNHNLKTDATGKTRFDFYNADGPGTYKVIVEGISATGELGRQVLRYTVTE